MSANLAIAASSMNAAKQHLDHASTITACCDQAGRDFNARFRVLRNRSARLRASRFKEQLDHEVSRWMTRFTNDDAIGSHSCLLIELRRRSLAPGGNPCSQPAGSVLSSSCACLAAQKAR